VRVIAGSARGRPLTAPPGRGVRPTSDRVREALFSALADEVPGAVVLDLFAGSGALGIEALSRGADLAVLVESEARALAAIAANLDRAGVADRALTVQADALSWDGDVRRGPQRRGPARRQPRGPIRRQAPGPAPQPPPYDLVLADPPYRLPLARLLATLERFAAAGLLAPGARVVVERDRRDPDLDRPPGGPLLTLERDRTYGDTVLRWLRVRHPGA